MNNNNDHNAVPPRLTQTMINHLITESPLHAWTANPLLNPDYEAEPSKEMDFGNIVHALLLKGEDLAEPIAHNDYRTDKARELRDEIRASGKYPILQKDTTRVKHVCEAARMQLAVHRDIPFAFQDGDAEVTLGWTDPDTGVVCKARLDWLSGNKRQIVDLKCTTASAHPDAVARRIAQMGYDVQGVFYQRGVRAVYDREAEFYLVTVEVNPPYALSVVGLDPTYKWLGAKKCDEGARLWKECLLTGIWPGYPHQTCWATLPAWAEKDWLAREEREAV